MPTIINPYGNSKTMGDDLFGLGGIADAFFGPKASQSALYREKFKEAARQNEFLPQYATALGAGGDPGRIAELGILAGQTGADVGNYGRYVTANRGAANLEDPRVTAAIIGAGGAASSTPQYTTAAENLRRDLDLEKTNRILAADELKNQRELIQVHDPASSLGYKSITRAEFLANPGKYIQVAPSDISKSAAASKYLFPNAGAAPPAITAAPLPSLGLSPDNPLTGIMSVPAFGGAPAAPATSPALTPEQRHYLGADPKKPDFFNWIAPSETPGGPPRVGTSIDGVTDFTTKQPLPIGHQLYTPGSQGGANAMTSAFQPGTAGKKDLQSAIRNADQTISLTGQIKQLVTADPTLVGAVGNIRRAGQEVVDVGRSVNMLFGGPERAEQTLNNARASLAARTPGGLEAARKILPALFDSNLNSIQTLNGLLVYQAAAAIGQDGRNASDADIKRVLSIVGSPDQWMQGPQTYLSKVTQLEQIITQQRESDVKILQGGDVRLGGGTTPSPQLPLPDLHRRYGLTPRPGGQ